MTTRSQRARIGLFTILAGALLAIVLFVFGGLRLWGGRDHYTVTFDGSVMGLQKGAQVYLNGIRVGSVENIELAPQDLDKVHVEIAIKDGTPIHTDTRAMLQMAGITGLKVIDLRKGSLAAPVLPPGSMIAQGETTLDKLEKQAADLVDQSTQLMGRASKVVDNLIAATDPMSEIAINAKHTSANMAAASAGLDATIRENRAGLKQTIASVGESAKSAQAMIDGQIAQILANAGDLVAEMKGVVRDNGGALRAAVADLRQASRSFKELSREVRQKPSRLLFSGSQRDRKLP
ncbi:MAG: MCE family protein [Deltaproteobacteria bacterium]|nr:MCE family protein [Deltaproteobacteria bacterium]